MQHYDLIIIGNGLAGASLIQAIKHLPLRVALLDRKPHSPSDHSNNRSTDARPITLNHTSTTILKTLGLWSALTTQATPLEHLLITEQNRFGQLQVSAEEMGLSSLGHVMPYALLEHQLQTHTTDTLTIDRLTSLQLLDIQNNPDGATITYRDNTPCTRTVFAPLLIAADGTESPVRSLLNITSTRHNSGDCAFVFHAHLSQPTPHPTTAYQRFTRRGSLAWLPSWNPNQARIVWTVPQKHLASMQTWDEQAWITHLNQTYQGRQPIIQSGKITGQYPLITQTHETCVHHSTILIGNAAHALYPITAQGFNVTLLSVAMLAETLTDNYLQHQSIKHSASFSRYDAWCRTAHTRITESTQRIDQIFSSPFIGPFRSLGLLAANINPIVKKHLLKPFLGWHATLPRLACQIPLKPAGDSIDIAQPLETL